MKGDDNEDRDRQSERNGFGQGARNTCAGITHTHQHHDMLLAHKWCCYSNRQCRWLTDWYWTWRQCMLLRCRNVLWWYYWRYCRRSAW